jgi:hypothetical protein
MCYLIFVEPLFLLNEIWDTARECGCTSKYCMQEPCNQTVPGVGGRVDAVLKTVFDDTGVLDRCCCICKYM